MKVLNCVKARKKDWADGFEEGRKEGVRMAVEFIMFSVIQFLGDKRGWKRERIMEAVKWIAKHANMIEEEYTTFPEVVEAVRDEYGIVYQDGAFGMIENWNGGDQG